jgi:hypothetical protein
MRDRPSHLSFPPARRRLICPLVPPVKLGRRSAIFSQRVPTALPPGMEHNVEAQWAAWIEDEVAKRVALVIFAVDVERESPCSPPSASNPINPAPFARRSDASFFRHSPTLSAFQIQLQLPCDEDEWEAPNAQEWARLRANSRPPIPFISALKASLMPGHAPPVLNPFSRIAILHGLLSVAQDLQWCVSSLCSSFASLFGGMLSDFR